MTGRQQAAIVGAGAAALVAALVLGSAAMLLATRWSDHPGVFVTTGLLAAAAACAATMALATRRRPPRHRQWIVLVTAALATAVAAGSWLAPLQDPRPLAQGSGTRYWKLETGSELAFVLAPNAAPGRKSTPVLVLHGGPGIPDLPGDSAYWGQLAEDGYEVYTYAQVGSATSTRLGDVTKYSLTRDVADLEQIRRTLGADRMILIGHSYGGTLAAAYLAAHPTHVARLVLSSPGPLNPNDLSGNQAQARLATRDRITTYTKALAPRALLGYLMLQINPRAAHAYLPDREADARNDSILRAAATGLHCADRAPERVSGSGFYRLQYPQSATAPPLPDLRRQLTGQDTPVLLFKGRCDYQSWSSATDYTSALPDTTLIYLKDAGHNTYQDEPDIVLAATRAFLTDQPLPLTPYFATTAPGDYQTR